ncbi:hypothetical protein RSOLAG22IIIB_08662 [Rhizoctonia solani]|uniref:Uncharacterized protein n=1 Tax=Rhizoctonia solani TaxID=456999 RepID=A0A0K6FTX5_9AGAM|nr:hypothetical protein RSOLAG22IIIB_08662 [Rhizoctonia solani]
MLFNFVLLFMWLHAYISPVGNVEVSVKFTSNAWASPLEAREMLLSNTFYLSSPSSPSPIPRFPIYSPLIVPVYVPETSDGIKSPRSGSQKRITLMRVWVNALSHRFNKLVKASLPPVPTKVTHFPTRVLRDEPIAFPSAAHQPPAGTLIDFYARLDAYKLVFAWASATFGSMAIILARFVQAARSEVNALNSIALDIPAVHEECVPHIHFGDSIAISHLVHPRLVHPRLHPFSLLDSALEFPTSITRDDAALVHPENPTDLHPESNPSLEAVDPKVVPVDRPGEAVQARIGSNVDHGSFASLEEFHAHLDDSNASSTPNEPAATPSTSLPDEEFTPEYKHQLGLFVADVLARQKRGEILEIGDLRLEDYPGVPADQPASLPPRQEPIRDVEAGISLDHAGVKSTPLPWQDPSISKVDAALIPLPADGGGISPSLSASSSSRLDSDDCQVEGNTSLDRQVAHDNAFADVCKEIGVSPSSFDLASQLDSVDTAANSSLPSSLSPSDSSAEESGAMSTSTSISDLMETILAESTAPALDNWSPSTLPSIFVPSPPFQLERTYDNLMQYHRRRANIHFDFSVHLVEPGQPQRLISHSIYSRLVYRTEAIGVLGQILTGSLKDAARVVGNCYPEARDHGAKFLVNVRIATVATHHHQDLDSKEWTSLGWQTRRLRSAIIAKFEQNPHCILRSALVLGTSMDASVMGQARRRLRSEAKDSRSFIIYSHLYRLCLAYDQDISAYSA